MSRRPARKWATGMTFSAVSLPYYRYILPYGIAKFLSVCGEHVEYGCQWKIRGADCSGRVSVYGKLDEGAGGSEIKNHK